VTDEELDAIERRVLAAGEWTPLFMAEGLTEGVYDMPAIESRDEFLEATAWWLKGALDGLECVPALVAEVRRLKDDHHKLGRWTDCKHCTQFFVQDEDGAYTNAMLEDKLRNLTAENDRLRAEVESLRTTLALDEPCEAVAEDGVDPCLLHMGHDGDHDFVLNVDAGDVE
jgi:hypothetical protein